MKILLSIFMIPVAVVIILNRGGASLSLGVNIMIIIVCFSLFSLFLLHTKIYIRKILIYLLFVYFFLIATLLKILNVNNFGEELLKDTILGILPVTLCLGVLIADSNKWNLDKFLYFLFSLCTLYGLSLPITKTILSNVIIVGGVSLFGIYGSYYINTVIAFIYFISKSKKSITTAYIWAPLALASTIMMTARNGLLAIIIAILVALFFRYSRKGVLKVFIPAVLGISAMFIILPLLYSSSIKLKFELLDVNFIYLQVLSIFDASAGSEKYNELFSGSRDHRINMISDTISNVFTNGSFWTGLPLNYPIVDDAIAHYNPHNGYLSIFGRFGIFGLIVFLSFLIYVLITLFIRLKNNSTSGLNIFLFISVLCSAQMIAFTTYLDSPMNAIIFYLILGITIKNWNDASDNLK